MQYIGLDVHQRTSTLCVIGPTGRVIRRQTIKGHPRCVVEHLRQIDQPFAVCYEASVGYGWLYDQLRAIAARVVVAHPGQLRLIFRSSHKNDRVDAEKLAKLLFLGEVPPVYVPSLDVRAWRGLIEHRHRCVAARTRSKNAIRALLRSHGVEAPKGIGLWTGKGMQWLDDLELPTAIAMLRRDQLIDDVRHHTKKIKRVEKMLKTIADKHPGIAVLRTIPGVGIRTAEAFLAYVDDADRFGKSKSIGRYFGLVPRQDASAGFNRMGRITKDGPGTVRKVLTEAAWQGIRRSPAIRAYYERMKHGRDDRNKKALIATAHYLARVMLAILKTGEAWREQDPSNAPTTEAA
jgi:transposase